MSGGVGTKEFWGALGQRAIGVTIVAAAGSEGPVGFLGLSATHVSAEPPTMMVSISPNTSALEAVRSSGAFSVNFVSHDDLTTAEAFLPGSNFTGSERFSMSAWGALESGAPVLGRALGALDCRVMEELKVAGAHIFFGEVVATSVADGGPLIWRKGALIP